MRRQLAGLRPEGSIPRSLVRNRRTVPALAAVALQLAAYRRCRSSKTARDRPQRHSSGHASRDLLALIEGQHASRSSPRYRSDAAMRLQVSKDRRRLLAERPADQAQPVTSLPAIPNLGALRRSEHPSSSLRHRITSPPNGKALRRPPETTVDSGHSAATRQSPNDAKRINLVADRQAIPLSTT